MKNKSFFAAVLIFATAFLFISCDQIGGSNAGSNSGSGIPQIPNFPPLGPDAAELQQVWELSNMKYAFIQIPSATDYPPESKFYLYFGPDGFMYAVISPPPNTQIGKLSDKLPYSAAGGKITVMDIESGGPGFVESTYKIQGNNLTVTGDKFSLTGTKSSTYTPNQIMNAGQPPQPLPPPITGTPNGRVLQITSFEPITLTGAYTIKKGEEYNEAGNFRIELDGSGENAKPKKIILSGNQPNSALDGEYDIDPTHFTFIIDGETFKLP